MEYSDIEEDLDDSADTRKSLLEEDLVDDPEPDDKTWFSAEEERHERIFRQFVDLRRQHDAYESNLKEVEEWISSRIPLALFRYEIQPYLCDLDFQDVVKCRVDSIVRRYYQPYDMAPCPLYRANEEVDYRVFIYDTGVTDYRLSFSKMIYLELAEIPDRLRYRFERRWQNRERWHQYRMKLKDLWLSFCLCLNREYLINEKGELIDDSESMCIDDSYYWKWIYTIDDVRADREISQRELFREGYSFVWFEIPMTEEARIVSQTYKVQFSLVRNDETVTYYKSQVFEV